jgi:hypothetical protein
MKTYIVSQTFYTLGDPCRAEYETEQDAANAAAVLRRDIAQMVAGWETSRELTRKPGSANEIEAWRSAAETAGVKFDDDGERTPDSPETYGLAAGEEIAAQAVEIEEEEEP